MIRLNFFGAAGTVTGSRYLLETDRARVLFDCGLFQGLKELRLRNWAQLPFEPASLDAVVLSHAHIDHAGYLPRLCRDGFRGRVWCTPATRALLDILLPDAGHLQEEEARHANRAGYSRHRPALPLFTRQDADLSLEQVVTARYGERFEPAPGVEVAFRRAGHILGASSVWVGAGGTSLVFSGDVGRPADPVMKAPEPLEPAEHLIVESTYGDRRHPSNDIAAEVAQVVHDTAARGGVVVVPAFAVGRAQHLLHLLATLRAAGRLPELPIFLDSPMAIDATALYREHRDEHRLSDDECAAMFRLARFSHTADDSKAIDRRDGPMIVISASGMATGGRVLHHLARFLPDPASTILFVGYQGAGTRGRSLVDGADELKLHGQYVPVRAKVVQLEGLSAHADHAEMIAWLRRAELSPRRVFVTHGEPSAADGFRRRLRDSFGWDVVVPAYASAFNLGGE